MAVVTSSYSKKNIFSLKNTFKKIISNIIPNYVVLQFMKNSFTHFGMEISNACNANCSFCAYRFMQRKVSIIDNEATEKSVDEFSKIGGGTVSFTPVVGDPLVDKNLIEKIKICAKKKNIDEIFLYTNGIFLDKFDNKKLLSSGLTRIAISTYIGTKENYKKYYGKDYYDRVIKNIIHLSELNYSAGRPINITLHLRVDMPKDIWIDNDDLQKISKFIGSENISWLETYENWSGLITKEDIPNGCELSEIKTIDEKIKSPCFEMYRRIHVLSDGNVGVCSCRDIDAEINIGNIKNQSLKELWNGKKLKDYRSEWKKGNLPDICKNCDRYQPVNEFVKQNKYSILQTHIKRLFK